MRLARIRTGNIQQSRLDAENSKGGIGMTADDLQEELTLIRRQLRDAMKLLETAECGAVGSQAQMWEQKLQELENEVDLKKLK